MRRYSVFAVLLELAWLVTAWPVFALSSLSGFPCLVLQVEGGIFGSRCWGRGVKSL